MHQIRLRARRLGVDNEKIWFSTETNLESLIGFVQERSFDLIIIDSIHTVYSDRVDSIPGNVAQIRTCAGELMRYTKNSGTPVILIGHVTKEGNIAGPKILEHMVDTVLYFEGDLYHDYRMLRATKNRFGPVNSIGLFRMREDGLDAVTNPSELFLDPDAESRSGDAIVAVMEGNRPFLIKVQALVTKTQFGVPQRTATGIDHRRMNLLLAVLEKRAAKPFSFQDVFVKVAGGFRMDEPAGDLGICMALISSLEENALPSNSVYIGEIGLGGEIRGVSRLRERIEEAHKLGYTNIFVPKIDTALKNSDIKVKVVRHLHDLL